MVNYTCMQNVKLMVGEGCHTQMGEALKEAGYKKAFVVYDGGVKVAGIIDKVLESLRIAEIAYTEFDKVLREQNYVKKRHVIVLLVLVEAVQLTPQKASTFCV